MAMEKGAAVSELIKLNFYISKGNSRNSNSLQKRSHFSAINSTTKTQLLRKHSFRINADSGQYIRGVWSSVEYYEGPCITMQSYERLESSIDDYRQV